MNHPGRPAARRRSADDRRRRMVRQPRASRRYDGDRRAVGVLGEPKVVVSGVRLAKVNCSKLTGMGRLVLVMRILAVGIVLTGSINKSLARSGASTKAPQGEVVLSRLAKPFYPPLARQARITGDVELMLEVRRDGSIKSVNVVSGHPLLKQAALDSAQQSQFDCNKCSEAGTSVRLVFTFQLTGTETCCTATDSSAKNDQPDQPTPRVIQSENHVTVVDRPACICDPPADIRKVRSLKCLYLWKCASR